ncbi:hypothetical protein KKA17_06885 [bacterium]|nr:hypothetical protein [bacterium]MBU1884338.1 hypothetical protein [bacterium]
MIAIPVDSASKDAKSSHLFGNVKTFAIYKPTEDAFFFMKNEESGNGIQTAKLLKKWDVKSVVYSYMGKGLFQELDDSDINVYYLGKEPLGLFEIVEKIADNSFIKVDADNASTYLDPGTSSQNCECSQ